MAFSESALFFCGLFWLTCWLTDAFCDRDGCKRVHEVKESELMTREPQRARQCRTRVGFNWKRKRATWLFTALLLLLGDIHPNPGPTREMNNSLVSASSEINDSVVDSGGNESMVDSVRNGCLRCRSLNARSVVNKRLQLRGLLESERLDVLAVTETFLGEDILDSEIVDNTYKIFRRDLDSNCELLWVELVLPAIKILVGVFYHPPSSPREYLSQLDDSLTRIPASSSIILCGDFNAPRINWESVSCVTSAGVTSKLCDLVLDHSLQQLVSEPTRDENVLDLLLINCPGRVRGVKVVVNFPGADHDAVHFLLDVGRWLVRRSERKVYNFKKADFNQFKDLLATVPWDCCFSESGVEEIWVKFKDLLFLVADQCIPKVTLRPKKSKHWLSQETLHMIRKKKHAFKLAKRSQKDMHFRKYRVISNRVRDLTRKDHREHLSGGSRGGGQGGRCPPPRASVLFFFSTIISALALTSIVFLLSM